MNYAKNTKAFDGNNYSSIEQSPLGYFSLNSKRLPDGSLFNIPNNRLQPVHKPFHTVHGFFNLFIGGGIAAAGKSLTAGAKGFAGHHGH